jgi:hypothetical protein
MRKFILALFAWLALASLAQADFTGKDASLATITFKNATGACTAVVCVPQAAITDSTGATFVAVVTAGADAQSNTANGLLTYTRNLVFNGTTWDRWQGAVTNAGTFAVQLTGATNNINNIAGTVSLPTGAATAANQATEIGSLATIASNTGAPIPAGTNIVGFTSGDPCSQLTKLGAPVNLTASGQVITGTSAKKNYICSIDIVSSTAQNIALVEGTGTVCATNIFGLAGGTTAVTGWNFAANGGLTKGAGSGTVYSPSADTFAAAANVCLLLSGSGQTSGQITYVQQ